MEAKQVRRSAAWHKGARDFAQDCLNLTFSPLGSSSGIDFLDGYSALALGSFRDAICHVEHRLIMSGSACTLRLFSTEPLSRFGHAHAALQNHWTLFDSESRSVVVQCPTTRSAPQCLPRHWSQQKQKKRE